MHRSIDIPEIVALPDGCWLWTRAEGGKGYARWTRRDEHRGRAAHRVIFEALHGQIPEGMHLDHLCRFIRCVNPGHMEVVTPSVNQQRRDEAFRRKRARKSLASLS